MVSGGKKIQDVSVDEFLFILKDLQVKFLEPEIRRIVKEEFAEERQNFWVPAERHYQEHLRLEKCVQNSPEIDANHAFVSRWRSRGQKAFNVGFALAIVGVCGLVATIVSDGFRQALARFLGILGETR